MGEPMTYERLVQIEVRLAAATPGPWYWRVGNHVPDPKKAEAGGLRTRTPCPITMPDGAVVQSDVVIIPVGVIDGDPYWVQRFRERASRRPAPLGLSLECFGREEDKDLIACAPEDLRALLAEVRRLRAMLEERSPA